MSTCCTCILPQADRKSPEGGLEEEEDSHLSSLPEEPVRVRYAALMHECVSHSVSLTVSSLYWVPEAGGLFEVGGTDTSFLPSSESYMCACI